MNGKNGSKTRGNVDSSIDSKQEKLFSYYDEIRRYLRAFGIAAEDLEDVLDEVFIIGLTHIDKVRDESKIKNYLLVTAKNAAMTYFSDRIAEAGRLVSLDEIHEVCYCDNEDEDIVAEICTQSDGFRDMDLHNAMQMLRPEESAIIRLYYIHGYSFVEISRLTKLSHENVRVIAFRARRRLRRFLEDMGYER